MKNFISYLDIQNELKTNNYNGVLLKFGSERCPPCRALDMGPLEELNNLVNRRLLNNKKLLIVNCNLSIHNFTELIAETNISLPNSIPAFFLFKYDMTKSNLLNLKYESLGYDMYNPQKWLENMTNIIVDNLQ